MRIKEILQSSLFWITLSLPLVLWYVIDIYPTFDDWTSTPGPNPDEFSWSLLLPRVSYWRPLESLYGWCLAHYRWLMPWLSHLIIISGHYIGCIFVYRIAKALGFKRTSCNIAAIAFWISVGAIATTTACDGMSQTWVHTIGLIALYIYLINAKNRNVSLSWMLLVFLATIVKENGICWGVIIPLIGYAFGFTDKKNTLTQIAFAILFALAYSAVHFTIPTAENYQFKEEYFDFSIIRFIRGVCLWLTYSWIPIDYIHLLHAPHRNLIYVALSAIAVLPFLCFIGVRIYKGFMDIRLIALSAAAIVLVAPHLLTIFSLMHVYASLGIIALVIGYLSQHLLEKRFFIHSFCMFAITSAIVNAEHCKAAYDAGEVCKKLSIEAIKGAGEPVKKAYIINIDNGETRYSNFYVLPLETIGWGRSILWETEYKWPEKIPSITVNGNNHASVKPLTDSLINTAGYDCVWILENYEIKTVKK